MRAFGIAGYSGSGKTTLLERLVPRIVARCLSLSLVKHAHHGFDLDRPGKDSFRLREAGCSEVMLASDQRWALMGELRGAPEPTLEQLLARMSPCDLVLVEGFKSYPGLKIEVHRSSLGPELMTNADGLLAVVSDGAPEVSVPVFRPREVTAVADFLEREVLRRR